MRFRKILSGNYTVFEDGDILSHLRKTPIILKPSISKQGYAKVALVKDGKKIHKLVHRLVALCFLPRQHKDLEVNHKDFNKLNNNLENLEWVTRQDNQVHKHNRLYICKHIDGGLVKTNNLKEFAKSRGLSQGTLSEVALGRRGRTQHLGWRVEISDL